ncbi:MAG TPA: IS66 family insertion sequence element accessory protein TnpB [Candidatus Obscuribacterales bacterium]
MLSLPPSTKIFLCSEPVDMRKSFDALSGLVTTHFGQNPLSGHLFVFFSRRRDCMKILLWDLDGFVLYYKRLESGTVAWLNDFGLGPNCQISSSDFAALLAGINPIKGQRQMRYRRLPETSLV